MSDRLQMAGTVKEVLETMTFASGFSKRDFVVTDDDDKYPQDILFEVVKDKCAELDTLQPGQRVTVHYNLRGRYNEKSGRYFNSLQAWRIESGEAGHAAPQPAATPPEPVGAGAEQHDPQAADGADNLPF